MLDKAQRSFQRLARLGDPAINAGLIAALDRTEPGTETDFQRANLLRRAGKLAGARQAFATFLDSGHAPAGIDLHRWSVVPPGLRSASGYAIAPLAVIDDFLPTERMSALHAHACAREAKFQIAKATNPDAPPEYDPERRQTLLDWGFTLERDGFLAFVNENLAELQACLGLPQFEVDRVEIKLSNHVDGGFFKTHCDNRARYAEAGRAITWLYYFGEETPRFGGGELYVHDSKPSDELLSPAWFSTIAPLRNRFIAFPSWFYHAVAPTTLADGAFGAGRFAISGHIRKTADEGVAWWAKGLL